jgi:mRNA-degrading endonuclease RelE of RelBE toxin-antitoxin system
MDVIHPIRRGRGALVKANPLLITPPSISVDITASMAHTQSMVIIETPIFTRLLLNTLSDDEYRLFQQVLLKRPDAGNIIHGSGGIRKLRWPVKGRGKRGGVRVIYYWFAERDIILLLFIYPKNIQDSLTPDQLKQLKRVVEEEYNEG